MGSLSVALGLQPDRALLNDANIHLVNLYHHLQQGLAVTIEMKNERSAYS
jgi:DNA adenine methylase